MQPSNPILTIAIPTYNGEKFISEAIDSIFNQIDPIEQEIEVLVSNNCSTDSTVDLVLAHRFSKNIRLISHGVNLGYDKNIISIFDQARGEYLVMLGDDDYFQPGSIAKLLAAIKANKPDLILMSLSFLTVPQPQVSFNRRFDSDFPVNGLNDFFEKTMWDSSALSSVCFSSSKWHSIKELVGKFCGSNWMHFIILMEILKDNGKCFCLADNMVTIRVHNPRWATNFGNQLLSGFTHLKIVQSYYEKGNITESVYRKLVDSKYDLNFSAIVGLKPRDFFAQIEIFRNMRIFFGHRMLFWLVHVPLLFMPHFFLIRLRKLYRLVTFRR